MKNSFIFLFYSKKVNRFIIVNVKSQKVELVFWEGIGPTCEFWSMYANALREEKNKTLKCKN